MTNNDLAHRAKTYGKRESPCETCLYRRIQEDNRCYMGKVIIPRPIDCTLYKYYEDIGMGVSAVIPRENHKKNTAPNDYNVLLNGKIVFSGIGSEIANKYPIDKKNVANYALLGKLLAGKYIIERINV